MTSPGRWVAAGTAPVLDEVGKAREAVELMVPQQRAELFEALTKWENGELLPDSPAGKVAESLADNQKRIVLQVLREP